jgi:UDP-glucose:(heptosyl)LPS alpha-1,3-glucosyltransferase
MNVTICSKLFGKSGGAETFLRNFARALVADGHALRVITASPGDPIDGVEVVPLRLPHVPHALADRALARTSRKALARESADVTFSDQKCWGADVVRPGGGVQRAYVQQRDKSYPTAASRFCNRLWHGVSLRERLRLRIDDRLYAPPGPKLVIANSDMTRRNIERHYPHMKDRIRVVYNGADPARFHPGLRAQRDAVRTELGIPDNALVCIFVGHDWRRKGLFPLIEALGILVRKGTERPVYGVVAGRGKRGVAERWARRHGADGVLKFAGADDPDRYYGAADLLVLPTFFDPCANVTVEALACGLPAITSTHNGAFEMLEPGLSGFFGADPTDSPQLAGFIEHYLDDARLAAGRRAALEVAARYVLADQLAKIVAAVKEIADR